MGRVTFLGACGTVTGSSTLLAWGKTRLLVDCGMFQGPEEVEQRNFLPFPYRPDELDGVVLTHAHLDHTGLLPRLVALLSVSTARTKHTATVLNVTSILRPAATSPSASGQ